MLNHLKVSTKGDGTDPSLVQPSDWNADHVFTGDVTLPANLIVTNGITTQALFIHNDINSEVGYRITNTNSGIGAKMGTVWDNGSQQLVMYMGGQNTSVTNIFDRAQVASLWTSGVSLNIGTLNAAPMIFATSSLEKMRLDAAGNLGIGTTGATNLLEARRDQNTQSRIDVVNQLDGTAAQAAVYATAGWIGGFSVQNNSFTPAGPTSPKAMSLFTNAENGIFYNATSGVARHRWFANNVELMHLDFNGNLGIGMAPGSGHRIDISHDLAGEAQVRVYNPNNGAGSAAGFYAQAAGGTLTMMRHHALGMTSAFPSFAGGGLVYSNGPGGLAICSGAAGTPLYFGSGSTERMTIRGNGTVQVGNPSETGDIGKFSVWQSVGSGTSKVICAASNIAADVCISCENYGSGLFNMMQCWVAGVVIGGITADNSSVHFITNSDERLKNILTAQRDFGNIIDNIWVGDFEFKAFPGKAKIGVISQQMAPLFPDPCYIPDDPEKMQEVDYGAMSPLALWGVKNLRSRVADLEARLTAGGL